MFFYNFSNQVFMTDKSAGEAKAVGLIINKCLHKHYWSRQDLRLCRAQTAHFSLCLFCGVLEGLPSCFLPDVVLRLVVFPGQVAGGAFAGDFDHGELLPVAGEITGRLAGTGIPAVLLQLSWGHKRSLTLWFAGETLKKTKAVGDGLSKC